MQHSAVRYHPSRLFELCLPFSETVFVSEVKSLASLNEVLTFFRLPGLAHIFAQVFILALVLFPIVIIALVFLVFVVLALVVIGVGDLSPQSLVFIVYINVLFSDNRKYN